MLPRPLLMVAMLADVYALELADHQQQYQPHIWMPSTIRVKKMSDFVLFW